MDYKKLHKDTIAKLQEMVNSGKITVEIARGICADFISESDDERMIKFIKNQLFNIKKTITENYELDAKLTKAIDWLEKQGEQHLKFRVGDTIKKESTGDIVTVSEIDLKNREYRLSNTGFIPFKYEHLWELVEQKPADKVEPKFKIGQTIKKEGFNLGFTIVKIEDGFYYNDMGDNFPFTDQDNWELVDESPAWSKEDEEMLRRCISATFDHGYLKECNWLKSLKSQPTWKPSDNELEVLRLAAEKDGACLMGLYEQLKKLK